MTHSKGKVGSATKVEITTEEEQTSTSKKVTKAKVRDEINFATKKIENEDKGDEYHASDMVSP